MMTVKSLPINNSCKCKWIKFPNQKTIAVFMDLKTNTSVSIVDYLLSISDPD